MIPARSRRPLRALLLASLAAAAAASSGCYERVVGAKGFGADSTGISDPNVSAPRTDRVLGYPTYKPRRMPGS